MKNIKKLFIYFYCLSMWANQLIGQQNTGFKLGLENISHEFIQKLQAYNFHGARIGLVTNHTGKDQKGNRNVDLLIKQGLRIVYIFAPEHGYDGSVSAAHAVRNSYDSKTNIPIISLYGKGTGVDIMQHHMQHLDMLMFDIQDVGMRHYTYISTLLHTMQTAAHYDKQFVVLDRPNPLGVRMEGPVVSHEIQQLNSFIAAAPIPLRHGMTIGELAWYFNTHVLKKPAKLHVIKMQNYDRRLGLHSELRESISPNITSTQACYGYSFLGLLGEVRPFSVGLASDYAFRCFALPTSSPISKQMWQQIQNVLRLAGITVSPYAFQNSRTKNYYQGLKISIANINEVASFDALLQIFKLVKNKGISLQFSNYFNRAVGTDMVQKYLEGRIKKNVLARIINKDLISFFEQARDSFMYFPLPHCGLMQE